MSDAAEASSDSNGLILSSTDSIASFLRSASQDPTLSQNLKQLANELSLVDNIPYASLRSIWISYHPSYSPNLLSLLNGSRLIFSSPKPREKSDELKARLKKLEELEERKAYRELVKDIFPKENAREPLSSYKEQLGFGLHIVLIMFTGYLLGCAAFRALFGHSVAMGAAGGVLGMAGGMVLETVLFIVRASHGPHPTSSKAKKDQ